MTGQSFLLEQPDRLSVLTQTQLALRHRGCLTEKVIGKSVLIQIAGERGWDLLALYSNDADLRDLIFSECGLAGDTEGRVIDTAEGVTVFIGENEPDGVLATIRSHNGFILWPVVYRNGLEIITFVTQDLGAARDVVAALERIGDVIERRHNKIASHALDVTIPASVLLAGLTLIQADALRVALESGYYDVPRQTDLRMLAAAKGVTSATFREHLRKAERSLLGALGSLLDSNPHVLDHSKKGIGRPPASGGRPRTRRPHAERGLDRRSTAGGGGSH